MVVELNVPESSVEELRVATGRAMGGCGKKMPAESEAVKRRTKRFRYGMYDPGVKEERSIHRQVLRFRNLIEQSLEVLNGTDELTITQAMLVTSATRCEQTLQMAMGQLSKCDLGTEMDKLMKLNNMVLKSTRMRDWYLMQLGLTEKAKLDPLEA